MDMQRSAWVAVVALVGGTFSALAQSDPEALARLEAAAKAMRTVKGVSYTIKAETKMGPTMSINADGTVEMLRREEGQQTWLVRREGVSKTTGMEDIKYLVATDDQIAQWLDPVKKVAYEKFMSSAKDRQITVSENAWVRELGEREPFARQIGAAEHKLSGSETLDGVPCDVVVVSFGPNRETVKWWVSATDSLPRRVVRELPGMMTTTYDLTNVKVNPEIVRERFKLPTPEGYKDDRLIRPETMPNPKGGHVGEGDGAFGDGTAAQAPPRMAPDFELAGPDGKAVKLEELRGNVVVLDFWGTWCFPCKKSSPEVQKLHEKYKDKKVKVYGLAVRESDDQAPVKYMKDGNFTYPILLKADPVAEKFQVKSYPTFVVIGFDGSIIHEAKGFKANETFAELNRVIDAYLQSDGKVVPGRAVRPNSDASSIPLTRGADDGSTTTTAPPVKKDK